MDATDIEGKEINTNLYGKSDTVPFRSIELLFLPCYTYKHNSINKNRMEIPCHAKRHDSRKTLRRKFKQSIAYLTMPDLTLIINSARVDIRKFGKESIVRESVVVNK